MRFIASIFIILFLSIASDASAQITADRVIVYWEAGTAPVRNVVVRNAADVPMLVEARVAETGKDGMALPGGKDSEELLASPKRFSIPALGQRTVRLLFRGSRTEVEKTFRVSFVPLAREDNLKGDSSANARVLKTELKLLSGVGMLIFISPPQKQPKFSWEFQNDALVFTNEGNVNVLVDRIELCSGDDQCEKLPAKRVYAGMTHKIPNVKGKSIRFRKRIGEEVEDVHLP